MNALEMVFFGAFVTHAAYSSYIDHRAIHYHGSLAKPVVLKSGYLEDTHEVAAAKSAHQVALEKQSQYGHHNEEGHQFNHDDQHSTPYHGPLAKPVVLKSGYLEDTHEVAAAKSAHQVALDKQSPYGHFNEEGHQFNHDDQHSAPYHGLLAKPVVLKSGYLEDTHEVAEAKIAHRNAVERQSHHKYHNEGDHEFSHDDHDHLKYHGPTTIPHVLQDGHIADTLEVAAARAEHFAAVAEAKHHGGYYQESDEDIYTRGNGHESHAIPYHGPLAKPVVLKSGFLADTHEVAAAKEHHLHALHFDNRHDEYY